MRVISYVDRRDQAPRSRSAELTAMAFRRRRKRKAGRRDKGLASVASAVQASLVLTLVGFINLGSALFPTKTCFTATFLASL